MESTAIAFDPLRTAPSEVSEALAAMGAFLGHLYRHPLTQEHATFFAALDPHDPNDLFMCNEACRRGATLMRDYCANQGPQAVAAASADFHRLFVGPLKLLAAPWSSVYMDLGSLFGPTALEVRLIFKRNGFEIPEGTREPSDHIGYELAFLAEVHGTLARATQQGDQASWSSALAEGRAFLRDYLLPWSNRFIDTVDAMARTDAYRGLAWLTRGHLQLEREFFGV